MDLFRFVVTEAMQAVVVMSCLRVHVLNRFFYHQDDREELMCCDLEVRR